MYREGVEFEPPTVNVVSPHTLSPVLPSHGWRTVSIITWVATLAALIAVAISSRTIGQPVWWLGSRVDPAPALLMLVPLTLIVVPLVATWRTPSAMVRTSLICSALLCATAIPDISNSAAIAIAVFIVGFASFLASIAQLMVMRKYR